MRNKGFTFQKFVVPNPFGPYEEPRFTAYLMKTRRPRAMSATISM
jgi:hypothetical protein